MKGRIYESVMIGVVMAILGAAISTYVEVRMLRHDVNQIRDDEVKALRKDLADLRHDLDRLWADSSDHVQEEALRPAHRRP